MGSVTILEAYVDIFDVKFEVVYNFFAEFVEHALLFVGVLGLGGEEFEGVSDVLLEEFLFIDLVELVGALFEGENDVDIFDGAGDWDRGQFGEGCLNARRSTSMLSLPMWLKATSTGNSRALK